MAFSKNLLLITVIIFLTIGFLGLNLSPYFFSQNVQAGDLQSSVSVIVTVCGDGTIDTGEVCDDGSGLNSNYGYYGAESRGYCLTDCSGYAPYCGDNEVQSEHGEECDDGNRTSGDGCSSSCQIEEEGEEEEEEPPPSGGGSVYIPPSTKTKVILQGKAYPSSSITVLKDGKVAVTTAADSQANFKIQITEITAGTYTFGIWAEDKEGRKSITFSFTTLVTSGTITTIGGIFLPPTIELDKIGLQRGEILNILGQTAPESEVSIFINSPEEIVKKTEAEEDGTWFYAFDTTPLEDGSHTSRAKAVSPGDLISTYSKTLSFYIGEGLPEGLCPGADFNKDGRVNLIDFSILLYWWKKDNSCCDQNQDSIVNIIDFSILLYHWTG